MTEAQKSELLEQAKLALKGGDLSRALEVLKKIDIASLSDYSFALKLSKFAKKLLGANIENSLKLRKIKIAILSSSTTNFLEPLFSYFGAINNFDISVKTGDFGNWRQDILNKTSWVYSFAPDFIVILSNYRDLNLPIFCACPDDFCATLSAEISAYWERIIKNCPNAVVIQSDFDSTLADSTSLLAYKVGGRFDTTRRLNKMLSERSLEFGGSVEILPQSEIRSLVGASAWEDSRMWFHAKQHPSLNALPSVVDSIVRIGKSKLVASKKVCVVDLDNTLWGGVIGEDGIGGIELGSPSARGEAFVAFQKYLKELKSRGVLLCVCSKNNERDALLPFEQHDAMVLKRDDFVCFSANWQPKSASISKMAIELNLGLDSFVFVDDNPAEIGEVSVALPDVETFLLPDDPADFAIAFSDKRYFDTLSFSNDDLARSEMYKQNLARAQAKVQAGDNIEDYLKSLEMKSFSSVVNDTNLARVAQLLNKTNQFNLATKRASEAEVDEYSANPKNYAKCFRLMDKFGDNGIVGVVMASPNGDTLNIDSFLMSCRVIGRGMENVMLNDVCAFAKAQGFSKVRGVYIATPKNSQTSNFYLSNGFSLESVDSSVNVKTFVANPKDIAIATFIKSH